jgi:hypothetical protein
MVPPAFRIVKLEPGSQVPFIVGVLSLVILPLIGHVIVRGGGAAVSIVNVVLVGILVFPTTSVIVTERVLEPSGKDIIGVKL